MKNLYKLVFRTSSFATILLASLSTMAFAQDAAPAPDVEKTMLDKWVIEGGWTMIPIVAVLFGIVFLVIYNVVALKKDKFIPEDLKVTLFQLMSECRIRSAIEVAAGSPSYLGRLVAYALPNVDATRPEDLGRDAVEDSIADFTANESRSLFKWLNMLSLCAQISPMLGLFGTVQGMVGAFATLSSSGQADPSQLAGNISVALLTTFWGLINAIIAVPFFFFLKNVANAQIAECIGTVQELVNTSINVVNAEAQLARIPEGLA
ncbi:MAG: MotA/TolQ/ExbB proton channel family protein [Akkermansia sp.]